LSWPTKPEKEYSPNSKIRTTKGLEGVWMMYQPEVGKVYDAEYYPQKIRGQPPMAVIIIKDKQIIVRQHEFELVEE
jgi:hypothetical protein